MPWSLVGENLALWLLYQLKRNRCFFFLCGSALFYKCARWSRKHLNVSRNCLSRVWSLLGEGSGEEIRTSFFSLHSFGSCCIISPIRFLLCYSEITGSICSSAADLHHSTSIASGAQSHGVWVSSNIISLLTRNLIAGSFEEGAKPAWKGWVEGCSSVYQKICFLENRSTLKLPSTTWIVSCSLGVGRI